jgi:hypothetical protein
LEEEHCDDPPQQRAAAEFHDETRDAAVREGIDPRMGNRLVEAIDGTLGECQKGCRNGGQHRLKEQIEHLRGWGQLGKLR